MRILAVQNTAISHVPVPATLHITRALQSTHPARQTITFTEQIRNTLRKVWDLDQTTLQATFSDRG